MLVTIDNLASRYHCLPSEALARATTFDLRVLDVGARWSNYKEELSQNGGKPLPRKPEDYSLAELTRIQKSVK